MSVTIGSGLGGFCAIAAQPSYGAAFVTPTRTLHFKANKPTHDPHIVQGGPYLAGGRLFDIGSAHEQMYLDAKGTLEGDMMDIGMALLLASAMGTAGTLTEFGTTAAYELGGAAGVTAEAPEKNNAFFDMQLAPPTTDGTQQKFNYHSCVITKAEWVFDRTGLVSYNYEWDAQYVESTTALIVPVYSTAPVPFSASTASSTFKIGNVGSAAATDGIRKVTVTLQRKMATERIYVGNEHKDVPVSNGLADLTVSIDADYTTAAKPVFDTFTTNTAQEIEVAAIGAEIGTSTKKKTFSLLAKNCFLQTGGEAPLAGPELVKNTWVFKGTIDTANDAALTSHLITADTAF